MVNTTSQLYYNGHIHKDIYFDNHYHKAMYRGNELLWEKNKKTSYGIGEIWYSDSWKNEIYAVCSVENLEDDKKVIGYALARLNYETFLFDYLGYAPRKESDINSDPFGKITKKSGKFRYGKNMISFTASESDIRLYYFLNTNEFFADLYFSHNETTIELFDHVKKTHATSFSVRQGLYDSNYMSFGNGTYSDGYPSSNPNTIFYNSFNGYSGEYRVYDKSDIENKWAALKGGFLNSSGYIVFLGDSLRYNQTSNSNYYDMMEISINPNTFKGTFSKKSLKDQIYYYSYSNGNSGYTKIKHNNRDYLRRDNVTAVSEYSLDLTSVQDASDYKYVISENIELINSLSDFYNASKHKLIITNGYTNIRRLYGQAIPMPDNFLKTNPYSFKILTNDKIYFQDKEVYDNGSFSESLFDYNLKKLKDLIET